MINYLLLTIAYFKIPKITQLCKYRVILFDLEKERDAQTYGINERAPEEPMNTEQLLYNDIGKRV